MNIKYLRRTYFPYLLAMLVVLCLFAINPPKAFASYATVNTGAADSITQTAAALHGSVPNVGTSSVSARGFEYGTSTSYGATANVATSEYAYYSRWGSSGSTDGRFNNPRDITKDSSGNFYVVDTNNYRIQKFDSDGHYLTQWGSQGTGNGEFLCPVGITVNANSDVYVADVCKNNVQKFTSTGTFITSIVVQDAFDVATDTDGNLYAVSSGDRVIQKFTSTGTFLLEWGSAGPDAGQFNFPTSIAIDASNKVYVADTSNNRVQKFDSNGNYLTQWGSQGTGNGEFTQPGGVAVDLSGDIYVADTGNHRVQKFDTNANYLTQWGSQGTGNGEFTQPHGVTFNSIGDVYVVDTSNDRIQFFKVTDNSGDFDSNISNLTCGTTYHYRAFAANDDGTSYGNDAEFTTNSCPEPADLEITKTLDSPGTIRNGESATYTITITNHGPATAIEGAYVYDVLPHGVEFNSVVGDNVGCEDSGEDWPFPGTSGHYISCGLSFGSIAIGESVSFQMVVDVISVDESQTTPNYALVFNQLDPEYQVFNQAFGTGTDPFSTLNNNSIVVHTYDPNGTVNDNDSIPYEIENAAPNSGDANNDGTPDSEQDNVASFVDSVTGLYAVLQVSNECSITSVSTVAESANTTQDSGFSYPTGLMDFTLDCGTPGTTATVTQYYYGASGSFVVRKYNPTTKTYSTIDTASISDQTIGGQPAKIATYQVKDGGSLDLDGAEDGNIHDPAGLATKSGSLANTGQNIRNIYLTATGLLIAGYAIIIYIKGINKHAV